MRKTHYETALRESMQGLTQRLSLGAREKPARVIAFISARRREGTTTVAAEYARTLGLENGQKVLLIDAAPPKLLARGEEDAQPSGIVDALIAAMPPKNAIRAAGDNISIGRWSAQGENHAVAVKMLRQPEFWQPMLKYFDAIVIDAPALQASFDGVALAASADAAVIVVEAEKTPQPVVMHLRDTLTASGAAIAGVVMNKRRYYIPNWVYKKL